MTIEDVIVSLLKRTQGATKYTVSDIAAESEFENEIFNYKDDAEVVWQRIMQRYKSKEDGYGLPYSLAEAQKLYALDPLVILAPLSDNFNINCLVAEYYVTFFLAVHYFDDHVEHREKFYSKFKFDAAVSSDTQHGAAPISFITMTIEILADILSEIVPNNADARYTILTDTTQTLLRQSRYFTAERTAKMSMEEVFIIKQRKVTGIAFALLARVMAAAKIIKDSDIATFEEALMSLGVMTQITDDIRDITIDAALGNANIVTAAETEYGAKAWDTVAKLYAQEAEKTAKHIGKFYSEEDLKIIISLPLYPFFVQKQNIKR